MKTLKCCAAALSHVSVKGKAMFVGGKDERFVTNSRSNFTLLTPLGCKAGKAHTIVYSLTIRLEIQISCVTREIARLVLLSLCVDWFTIGYFRVHVCLLFKASLSAKFLL